MYQYQYQYQYQYHINLNVFLLQPFHWDQYRCEKRGTYEGEAAMDIILSID